MNVTVTFAYPPSFSAATEVIVTARINGVIIATSAPNHVQVPANMTSGNGMLTIPLPTDDEVDSGDRMVVLTAETI